MNSYDEFVGLTFLETVISTVTINNLQVIADEDEDFSIYDPEDDSAIPTVLIEMSNDVKGQKHALGNSVSREFIYDIKFLTPKTRRDFSVYKREVVDFRRLVEQAFISTGKYVGVMDGDYADFAFGEINASGYAFKVALNPYRSNYTI